MPKKLALVALVALLACGLAGAQNHVNGYAGSSSTGSVYIYDSLGKSSTIMTGGSSVGYGLVMDRNNALLLVLNNDGNMFQIDPATQTVVGSLVTGVTNPHDIAVGQNGNYFITTWTEVYRLDAANALTTVVTGQATITGGMDIDINTGDLLVQSSTGTDPLLLIARDGSSITTVASGGDPRHGITQHIPTGDIYTGSCCGDQSPAENVFVYRGGGPAATVWLSSALPPVGVYSIKADRASAANQQLILGGYGASAARGSGGFFTIDIASKAVTRLSTLAAGLYETEILYRRNLSGTNTGNGTWQILTAIPEDAGYAYQVVVGASGVRSGVPLPDGRRINLTFDTLARVSATTGLAPFFKGATGTLNSKGQGVSLLNLKALGKAANGIVLHFLAVTLDAKAPLGVRTITDPFALKIEGL